MWINLINTNPPKGRPTPNLGTREKITNFLNETFRSPLTIV